MKRHDISISLLGYDMITIYIYTKLGRAKNADNYNYLLGHM